MSHESIIPLSTIDDALKIVRKIHREWARLANPVSTLTQNVVRKGKRDAAVLNNVNKNLKTVVQRARIMVDRTSAHQLATRKALGKVKTRVNPPAVIDALGMGGMLPLIQRGIYSTDWQRAMANAYVSSADAMQCVPGFLGAVNVLTSGTSGLANTMGGVKLASPAAVVGGGQATVAGAGVAALGALGWLQAFNPPALDTRSLFYNQNFHNEGSKRLAHTDVAPDKYHLTPAEKRDMNLLAHKPNVLRFVDYYIKKGWLPAHSVGITANLFRESGGNPRLEGDKEHGKFYAYGVGQWHPPRQKDFKGVFGHDIRTSTLDEQLQFYDWELHHKERRAGKKLKATTDAGEAGSVLSQYGERPLLKEKEKAIRGELARNIMQIYHQREEMRHKSSTHPSMESGAARMAPENDNLAEVLATAIQKIPIHVTVTAPHGTRVEVSKANKPSLPTRVNYSMPLGGML